MENGTITQMRADWILPENKRLEVTLKELNNPNLHVDVSSYRMWTVELLSFYSCDFTILRLV